MYILSLCSKEIKKRKHPVKVDGTGLLGGGPRTRTQGEKRYPKRERVYNLYLSPDLQSKRVNSRFNGTQEDDEGRSVPGLS